MSDQTSKTKSPPVPSYSLKDSIDDARKLYLRYAHAAFARAEVATTLGLSSASSSFSKRVFALSEYGLLTENAGQFSLTERFHVLHGSRPESSAFQGAAMQALRGSAVFSELLEQFKTKLPERTALAQRLETQRKFNPDRAREVAGLLEKGLQFARVLDANNNILPVRAEDNSGIEKSASPSGRTGGVDEEEREEDEDTPPIQKLRKTEVPLTDGRVAIVSYPHDLSTTEAQKIGRVLSALVE